MSRATAVRSILLGCALALSGCMNLDGFLFSPTRFEGPYRFDEASPELDGDLDPNGPHASLVPAANRMEGFVESAEGDQIHWVFASRPGARDTILYSHGNAHHLARYWDRVELLWQGGFNVLIYDYPGYGRSSGSPTESGVYASAEAALAHLLTLPGVNPDRIFAVGFSLGGAATYHLAARGVRGDGPALAGISSEAAFCSVEALIQDGAFLDLPVGYVSNLRMDNCARMAELGALPVLLRHGLADDFVVPSHAELLRAKGGAGLRVELVEGANHSTIPIALGERYLGGLYDFVERVP